MLSIPSTKYNTPSSRLFGFKIAKEKVITEGSPMKFFKADLSEKGFINSYKKLSLSAHSILGLAAFAILSTNPGQAIATSAPSCTHPRSSKVTNELLIPDKFKHLRTVLDSKIGKIDEALDRIGRQMQQRLIQQNQGAPRDPFIVTNNRMEPIDVEELRMRWEPIEKKSQQEAFAPRDTRELDSELAKYFAWKDADTATLALQRPEVKALADMTNEIMQDIPSIIKFYKSLNRKMIQRQLNNTTERTQRQLERWLTHEDSSYLGLAKASSVAVAVCDEIARPFGWKGVTEIQPEHAEFFERSIGLRLLPRDFAAIDLGTGHGIDSHVFQLTYLTEQLSAKIGSEKSMAWIEFLGSPEGRGLWHFLIDRADPHSSSFRSPSFNYFSGIGSLLNLE